MESRIPTAPPLPLPPPSKSYAFPTRPASQTNVPSLYHLTVQHFVDQYGPSVLQNLHMSHTPDAKDADASFYAVKGGMPFTGVSGQTRAGRLVKPKPPMTLPLGTFFPKSLTVTSPNTFASRPGVYQLMQQHIGTPNTPSPDPPPNRMDRFKNALLTQYPDLTNAQYFRYMHQGMEHLLALESLKPVKRPYPPTFSDAPDRPRQRARRDT